MNTIFCKFSVSKKTIILPIDYLYNSSILYTIEHNNNYLYVRNIKI